LISSQGEFILSRDWPENEQLPPADVVVAGTYAVAKDLVYITLKLFDLRSYQAVSSFAYTLPLGANTNALLQTHSWWDH
jgi:cation diffusion facilitator CzcD-associated flavoprotein CzcO